jgi:adenylate kinase
VLLQRDDDTEEKAKTRIQVYKDNIKPIEDLYAEEIITVDGNVGMDAVFKQIEGALNEWVGVKAA